MVGLKFRQVNVVFPPKVDKKMTTDGDQSGLMEFADTVDSPMYCTQLYVQLQHTKTILLLGEKKAQLHTFGACTPWKTGHIGQNWNILLTSHLFLISG